MFTRLMRDESVSRDHGCCPVIMRDELSHALVEALYELEVLPSEEDAALVGLYAVMADLQQAIQRTEALDTAALAR
jgi:hypothetical protein